jgi:hypothetical protein
MTPRYIPAPMSTMPVGTRVRHRDGTHGEVVRVVAAISGGAISLIRWDDLSQTRCGDDDIIVLGPGAIS